MDTSTSTLCCDYCRAPVTFQRVTLCPGPFTEMEPVDPGAGSDFLAIWCASCGPKHRWRGSAGQTTLPPLVCAATERTED